MTALSALIIGIGLGAALVRGLEALRARAYREGHGAGYERGVLVTYRRRP